MSDQENATQNAIAVTTESAPVTEAPVVETPAVEVAGSAPVEVPAEQNTEAEGAEPSKAVKELIAQRKRRQQAEQEAAYWRGRAESAGVTDKPQAPAPIITRPHAPPAPPSLDDFDTYEAYEAAKDEFIVAKTRYQLTQEYVKSEQQKQLHQVQSTFESRLEQAALTDPTIIDIRNDNTLPVSQPMAAVLLQSEQAPEILKWLDANRKEAYRISLMPPIMAARELGILEERIKSKPAPVPPKKVSQAPDPIPTVTAAGSAVVDEDNLPVDQWIARRNKAQFGR